MVSSVVVPLGVYGALEGQPLEGQNWRGRTGEWFRANWSSKLFEKSFTTSSCDATGTVQIRGADQHWLVAFTRPFAKRNQTTWRVARLAAGQLWDGLLPVVRALREPSDGEVLQLTELQVNLECNAGDRQRRRDLLPVLRNLASTQLPDSSERKTVGPAGNAGFDDVLVCAAFHSELVIRPCERQRGVVVLSRPAASREHKELLDAGWDAIFAPAPGGEDSSKVARNTSPFLLEPEHRAIRGASLEDLAALDDAEFDGLFAGFRGEREGDRRWTVPFRLVDASLRDDDEWRDTLQALAMGSVSTAEACALFERVSSPELLSRRIELALLVEEFGYDDRLSEVFLRRLGEGKDWTDELRSSCGPE